MGLPSLAAHCLVKLNMRYLLIIIAIVALTQRGQGSESVETGLWITGDPFIEDGVLFFRTDKPVQNNRAGNVVLLGAPKTNLNMFQILMRAAEKRLKVRLFGELSTFAGKVPGKHNPVPDVQFITWKIHMPDDPDELQQGKKIIVNPEDKLQVK